MNLQGRDNLWPSKNISRKVQNFRKFVGIAGKAKFF